MDLRVSPVDADPAFGAKVRRLASGAAARVVDLFSGCGGISLGFHRAGFVISGAVESDKWAAMSHAKNFHGRDPELLKLHAKPRDITDLEPEDFCAELDLGATEQAVDILVGGPPCQAYARVGRAKLREVAANPAAFKGDPRRNLYLRYIAWVDRLKPLAILMENVPDMMNQDGHNVAAEVVELLNMRGYTARYGLVNAAFYGVPQMRDRIFVLAYRRELSITPELPRPSRYLDLPIGYHSTRQVALKYVDLLSVGAYLSPTVETSLPYAVTTEQAIGDLPFLNGDAVKRAVRRAGPKTFLPYRQVDQLSVYAKEMREWPGFEAKEGIYDHFIRALPRDGSIFAVMPEGAEYPEAHQLAMDLFNAEVKLRKLRARTNAWKDLKKKMVPPYRTDTFTNKWWKLQRDRPSRTLMAHLSKDSYSHIHYDSQQRRTISVREAARLQSFPDGFVFAGAMNPYFQQIGNAVPPLLAFKFATVMHDALRAAALRLEVGPRD